MDRDLAERCTILFGLVESTVHGLDVNDGIEDRDEMGVCVEPLEAAMSPWDPFERSSTARHRAGRAPQTIRLLLLTPEDKLLHCEERSAAVPLAGVYKDPIKALNGHRLSRGRPDRAGRHPFDR